MALSIMTRAPPSFLRQLKNNISNNNKNNNSSRILQLLRTSSSSSRTYATSEVVEDDSNNNSNNVQPPPQQSHQQQQQQQYVSPFQDIFNTIKDGKTFLGTSEFAIPEIKYLNCGIPEHVLRFKTTAFDRILEEPFVHTNEHRVTLQVDVCHLNLDENGSGVEMMVLKEIVGSRLNEDTGVLQLSSNQFGSRIENKRHVVSMLERIIDSTRSLSKRIQQEVVA